MDKQELAVLIPVLAVFFTGLVVMSRTAIGKALARRIEGSSASPELEGEVRELRAEIDSLRADLLETQERLDFTERVVSSGKKDA